MGAAESPKPRGRPKYYGVPPKTGWPEFFGIDHAWYPSFGGLVRMNRLRRAAVPGAKCFIELPPQYLTQILAAVRSGKRAQISRLMHQLSSAATYIKLIAWLDKRGVKIIPLEKASVHQIAGRLGSTYNEKQFMNRVRERGWMTRIRHEADAQSFVVMHPGHLAGIELTYGVPKEKLEYLPPGRRYISALGFESTKAHYADPNRTAKDARWLAEQEEARNEVRGRHERSRREFMRLYGFAPLDETPKDAMPRAFLKEAESRPPGVNSRYRSEWQKARSLAERPRRRVERAVRARQRALDAIERELPETAWNAIARITARRRKLNTRLRRVRPFG